MSGKFNLNELENLAFSGGGMKGYAYIGAIEALASLPVSPPNDSTGWAETKSAEPEPAPGQVNALQKVKRVAGTSAGAITATLIAAGADAELLKMLSDQINFKELFKEKSLKKPTAPGAKEKKSFIERSSKNLHNTIEYAVSVALLKALKPNFRIDPDEAPYVVKSILDDTIKDLGTSNPEIENLLKYDNEKIKITFALLDKLKEHRPECHLKELYVNAVPIQKNTPAHDGKSHIFCAKTTPELDIIDAAIASASIPYYIEPKEIKLNGEVKKFTDGAVHKNIPYNLFLSKLINEKATRQEKDEINKKTIVFTLSTDTSDPNNLTSRAKDKLVRKHTGAHKSTSYSQSKHKHLNKIHGYAAPEKAFNGLAIDCSTDLTLLDLNANSDKKQGAIDSVKNRVMREFNEKSTLAEFLVSFQAFYKADSTRLSIYKTTAKSEEHQRGSRKVALMNSLCEKIIKSNRPESFKDNEALIIRLFQLACLDRQSGKLSTKTRAVKALIKAFNHLTHAGIKQKLRTLFDTPNEKTTINFKLSSSRMQRLLDNHHIAHPGAETTFKNYLYKNTQNLAKDTPKHFSSGMPS